MSWFRAGGKVEEERELASVPEVLACFRDEKALLFRLALLISGDEQIAEQSVVNACEVTVHGHSPFRDWLKEWAKAATITSAVSRCAGALRGCEAKHDKDHCEHSQHLSQVDAAQRERWLRLLLEAPPDAVLQKLDALVRAVLVLRISLRSSLQDCVFRLNVSRAAVIGANCQAMTWLSGREADQMRDRQDCPGSEPKMGTECQSRGF